MTIEEHKNLTADILSNANDVGVVSKILTTLGEDYGSILGELETAKRQIENLTATNDSLKEANMELFLKIGKATPENNENSTNEKEETSMSFEDLFDEKGELK